jgi:hypothetical protein
VVSKEGVVNRFIQIATVGASKGMAAENVFAGTIIKRIHTTYIQTMNGNDYILHSENRLR